MRKWKERGRGFLLMLAASFCFAVSASAAYLQMQASEYSCEAGGNVDIIVEYHSNEIIDVDDVKITFSDPGNIYDNGYLIENNLGTGASNMSRITLYAAADRAGDYTVSFSVGGETVSAKVSVSECPHSAEGYNFFVRDEKAALIDCWDETLPADYTTPSYVDGIPVSELFRTYCYCNSLVNVRIGAGTQQVGMGAFAFCESLKTVILPDSVDKVLNRAFQNCTNLEEVVFTGDFPMVVKGAFENASPVIVYPEGNPTWADAAADPAFSGLRLEPRAMEPDGAEEPEALPPEPESRPGSAVGIMVMAGCVLVICAILTVLLLRRRRNRLAQPAQSASNSGGARYCSRCGHPRSGSGAFCARCGTPFGHIRK